MPVASVARQRGAETLTFGEQKKKSKIGSTKSTRFFYIEDDEKKFQNIIQPKTRYFQAGGSVFGQFGHRNRLI